jgi:hypothetical protein
VAEGSTMSVDRIYFVLGYLGVSFVFSMAPTLVAFMLKKAWRWHVCAIGLVLFGKVSLEKFGLWPVISVVGYEPDWELIGPLLWFLVLALSVLGKERKPTS